MLKKHLNRNVCMYISLICDIILILFLFFLDTEEEFTNKFETRLATQLNFLFGPD